MLSSSDDDIHVKLSQKALPRCYCVDVLLRMCSHLLVWVVGGPS